MISEAAVIINPLSLGTELAVPPSPKTICLKALSLTSRVRTHVIRRGSSFRGLPWCNELSSIAERRLWADVIAWKSPVKWRLISSIGAIWAKPPPAAPPLTPKHGPNEGSRRHKQTFFSRRLSASANPMLTVVLPSPAGVGLRAVTRTNFAEGRKDDGGRDFTNTLALNLPYCSRTSSLSPSFPAIEEIGDNWTDLAISMSEGIDLIIAFSCENIR